MTAPATGIVFFSMLFMYVCFEVSIRSCDLESAAFAVYLQTLI